MQVPKDTLSVENTPGAGYIRSLKVMITRKGLSLLQTECVVIASSVVITILLYVQL